MSRSTAKHRRRILAREITIQSLYQFEMASRGSSPMEGARDLEEFVRQTAPDRDVADEALELIDGVLCRLDEIDERVAPVVTRWKPERIAAIDRAVIRLAVFVLLEPGDVPPKVAINEAIELAKKFSTEQSGSFVNGILDKIYRNLESDAPVAPRGDASGTESAKISEGDPESEGPSTSDPSKSGPFRSGDDDNPGETS
ncbi:MAG: transcription antitermination factor NusB [Planctomycetota bacterium]